MYTGKCCKCGHVVELRPLVFGPSPEQRKANVRDNATYLPNLAKQAADRFFRDHPNLKKTGAL